MLRCQVDITTPAKATQTSFYSRTWWASVTSVVLPKTAAIRIIFAV